MGIKRRLLRKNSDAGAGAGEFESALLPDLFNAWVRNKFVPIHFMLQRPGLKRPRERIEAAARTVYELCGHYCFDDDYEPYFFHLISILEKLPHVTPEECARGIGDMKAILRLFHIRWEDGSEASPNEKTSD